MGKLAAEPVAVEKADEETLKGLRKNESGKFRLINFGPRGVLRAWQ
jgi:hypothetical protein